MSATSGDKMHDLLKTCLKGCLGLSEASELSEVRLESVPYFYRTFSEDLHNIGKNLIKQGLSDDSFLKKIFSHLLLARLSTLSLEVLSRCPREFQEFYVRLHLDNLSFVAPSLEEASFLSAPFNSEEVLGPEPYASLGMTRGIKTLESVLNNVAQALRYLMAVEFILPEMPELMEERRKACAKKVFLSFDKIIDSRIYLDRSLAIVCYAQMRKTWLWLSTLPVEERSSDVLGLMKKLAEFEKEVFGYEVFYPEIFFPVFSSHVFTCHKRNYPDSSRFSHQEGGLRTPLLGPSTEESPLGEKNTKLTYFLFSLVRLLRSAWASASESASPSASASASALGFSSQKLGSTLVLPSCSSPEPGGSSRGDCTASCVPPW